MALTAFSSLADSGCGNSIGRVTALASNNVRVFVVHFPSYLFFVFKYYNVPDAEVKAEVFECGSGRAESKEHGAWHLKQRIQNSEISGQMTEVRGRKR
jgi:hypothetical protein